jgi:hypothetical protein
VQIRVGNNLWQADPTFKFNFLFFSEVLLYGFHQGHLSLTLVQNFLREFCKENDLLINWNGISYFFMSNLF